MAQTVAPDRAKYPDTDGCPPGSHYWGGIEGDSPLLPKTPACIIDPPPPDCPNGYVIETPIPDLSLPKRWECITCPEGTTALQVPDAGAKTVTCWSPPPRELLRRNVMSQQEVFSYLLPALVAVVAVWLLLNTLRRP